MKKFDARRFLEIAESERATHAMLVPVQYADCWRCPISTASISRASA